MRKAKCPECGCRFTPEETVKVKRKILPVADRTFSVDFPEKAMYGTITIDGKEIQVYLGRIESHIEGERNIFDGSVTTWRGKRKFILVEV